MLKNAGHQAEAFHGKHRGTSVGRSSTKKRSGSNLLLIISEMSTLRVLFYLLQSRVTVWLGRISITRFRFFYATNRINIPIRDQMKKRRSLMTSLQILELSSSHTARHINAPPPSVLRACSRTKLRTSKSLRSSGADGRESLAFGSSWGSNSST
jgi:hypothetical protein